MAGPFNPPGADGRAPAVAVGEQPYTPHVGFRPKKPLTDPIFPSNAGGGYNIPQPQGEPPRTATDTQGQEQDRQQERDYSGHDESGEYDGVQDSIAAGQAQGRQVGIKSPGEALLGGLGTLSGIPGVGWLADKAVAKGNEIGAPLFGLAEGQVRAGTPGSISGQTGGVWGGNTFYGDDDIERTSPNRTYDPITGRANAEYTDKGSAYNTWNTGRKALADRGVNPIGSALGSYENSIYNVTDAERQQGITAGSRAGVLDQNAPAEDGGYISRQGTRFGSSGINEGNPGQGTTFASGNLRTDSKGQVVEAALPTIGSNGLHTGDTAFSNEAADKATQQNYADQSGSDSYEEQVQAEKDVSLDAFGGSGGDSGGGGGK